jgi:hypothetical protein
MSAHKGASRSAERPLFELGPPIVERASLEPAPSADAVEFYFLTAAAQRAWAAISAARARGARALFWIGGPPGSGKTHFLNYVLALEERAGAEAGRRAVIRVDAGGCAWTEGVEQRLLGEFERVLGVAGGQSALWRRMRGAQALEVALAHARRVGVRALHLALDLGGAPLAGARDCIAELARTSAPREIQIAVFVAARGDQPPADALALDVAPNGERELMLAALARARRVLDTEAAAALYRAVDTDGFEPRSIFPFHPLALRALLATAGDPPAIPALAGLIAEVLDHWGPSAGCYSRPLMDVDLLRVAAVARRVAERLGESGRAALATAYRAADAHEDRAAARVAVETLMLEALAGAPALSVRGLRTRALAVSGGVAADRVAGGRNATERMLAALATRSAGVIIFDGRAARFDARAADAAQLARFNAALALARRFDATLAEAREPAEVPERLRRLDDAMRAAAEEARRVGVAFEAAARETRGTRAPLTAEHRRALEEFVALAEGGAHALIRIGADAARCEHAMRTVAGYEDLAIAAAAAARMRAMGEFLRDTGLRPDLAGDDCAGEGAGAPLVVECQLLLAALEAGVMPDARRRFEALEARFEKFRWTYLAVYRAAHERWRREGERLGAQLRDLREHLAAFARLDSIAALGPPEGAEFGVRAEHLARRIARCDEDESAGPQAARCARCRFVLGTALPARELDELFEQVRRALGRRLAALSHGAIARLIRLHDRGHRLDGFLKIIQAAHTEALVRVLDDELAAYLARLLEEAQDETRSASGARAAAETDAEAAGIKRIGRARPTD